MHVSLLLFVIGSLQAINLPALCDKLEQSSFTIASEKLKIQDKKFDLQKSFGGLFSASLNRKSPSDDADANTTSSGASLKIDLSLSNLSAINASSLALSAQEATFNNQDQKTLLDTATTYLDLVIHLKKHKSLLFQEKISQQYYKKSQAEFDEKIITKATLLSWESNAAQAKVKVLDNEFKIADNLKTLYQQTGVRISSINTFSNRNPIKITRKIGKQIPPYITAKKLEHASKSATAETSSLKMAFPTIEIDTRLPHMHQLTLALDFSGKNYADLMKAENGAKTARIDYLKAIRDNTGEIANRRQKLTTAKVKITAAVLGYESALARYQASKAEYEAGKINQLTLYDSIKNVTDRRVDLIKAQAEALKHHLHLQYENGSLDMNSIMRINEQMRSSEKIPNIILSEYE